MKALTVYQPWASLIMIGAKPWEFRRHDYRKRYHIQGQRIVIHAAARPIKPSEVHDVTYRINDGTSGLNPDLAIPLLDRLLCAAKCQGVLELSAGLGTVMIGTPKKATEIMAGVVDSDRIDERVWGWPMLEIKPFDHPIPYRGAQGFWNWPHAWEKYDHANRQRQRHRLHGRAGE